MGYALCLGSCVNCRRPISFNPVAVPSLVVNGSREPLCIDCYERWNEIHRTSKGLEKVPLHPDAYGACEDTEL
jgi:hypothetical protein